LRPNGFAGRELVELLKVNKYNDVSIDLIHHQFGNLTRDYFMNWVIMGALDSKIITQDEADKWNEELKRKVEEGAFLAYITNVVVSGTKP
jgi:hypothetical protein